MDTDSLPDALAEAARALPTLYADPAHYDVLAQMTAPDDLPFYRQLVSDAGGPVLELGCGTGRVLLALAEDGVEAFGVELSPAMLELARQKAEAAELPVTLGLGDLRSFDLERAFPLVLLTYNTVNHMLDDDSLARCLASAAKHMDADSLFVIDTFQPSLAFLAGPCSERRQILRYLDPYVNQEVRLEEANHYDSATQINRVVWSYEIGGRPDARVEELKMRLFFPRELDAWLPHAGFEVVDKFGDYEGATFGPGSAKQIYICRLARET